jgi:hypothetical protein
MVVLVRLAWQDTGAHEIQVGKTLRETPHAHVAMCFNLYHAGLTKCDTHLSLHIAVGYTSKTPANTARSAVSFV